MSCPTRSPLGAGRQMASVMLLLSVLASPAARAEAAPGVGTVILLQPTTASPAVRRAFARIANELTSDRFHVVVADSSRLQVVLGNESGSMMIALYGDPETGQAELCVTQSATGRAAVRRVIVIDDPERMPEALATRALELLRATALELSIEAERAPRPQSESRPGAVAAAVVPASPPPPPVLEAPAAARLAVDMGLGIWSSVEGPPPAMVPIGRVGVRLSDRTWARLSVAGWGGRPRVETAYGSATLSQSTALLEVAALFRCDRRVRPAVSLGAGVLGVSVAGMGAAPYVGREPGRWSAAVDGGVGVAFALGARASLVVELHGLVAFPRPVVRFVDTRAATVGYPSLIPTLALQVAP